jgi:hypothetical protein
LIESHQRKAVFLREASRGLPNVRVLARRSADVREAFDWAVSRAVRYEAVAADLRRMGRAQAVLAGELEPPEGGGFERIRLPWWERRYLYVSRGNTH